MNFGRSILSGALVCCAVACSDNPAPLLVVQVAVQQPDTDALGIITLIQSRGGRWLEVELTGATLSTGVSSACLSAPQSDLLSEDITPLQVFPKQTQAVITVRLFGDYQPIIAEGSAGAAGEAALGADTPSVLATFPHGACGIDAQPLRTVTKPISRADAPVLPSGTGGSGGSQASGGADTGGGGSMNGGAAGELNEGGVAGTVIEGGAAGEAGQGGA